jgi:hypothetical protein
MLFPKYALEDLTVGSGSIIGKGNIEEFFNHVTMHKDVEDRSLAELAPSYKVAAAYLVHMLEARFVNLNHFMQQMFLKLHDIKDSEKKDFILETLRREFRDVVIEARKVFEHFNMLGSRVEVVGTNKEEIKVPILTKECRIGPRYSPTWFLAQDGYHRRNHKAHEDIGLARPRDITWRTR